VKAPNNSQMLDSKLESAGQQAIRQVVHDLPEDTLSMAWRSSLNERLLAVPVARRPRFRFSWIAMPAGAAVACALAIAVFLHAPGSAMPQPQVRNGSSVETGLLEAYRQESVTHEIEGAGPDPSFDSSHPSIVDAASESINSEVDPESL